MFEFIPVTYDCDGSVVFVNVAHISKIFEHDGTMNIVVMDDPDIARAVSQTKEQLFAMINT
ncbi:hypothetical protein [Komagataeibacter europaeus]|uniref:hypothetical protein n=1 Tax=Komagataeibacter europaeus TaxID=33995 RepID=UPI0015FD6C61|nr:hypothetical protein [Komagataeibacter europaeus]